MKIDQLLIWQNSIVDKYRDLIALEDECAPEDVRYFILNLHKTIGDYKFYNFKQKELESADILFVVKEDEVLFAINEYRTYSDSIAITVEEYQRETERIYSELPIV